MTLHEPHAILIRKGPPRPQDAIAPIPASATTHDMTTEDDIGDAFTLLAEHGDAISMYMPGNREPVLGRILSVDPQLPHFVMELNEGAELTPGKVTFVTSLRSAKLQFRLSSNDWAPVPGRPVAAYPDGVPRKLLRTEQPPSEIQGQLCHLDTRAPSLRNINALHGMQPTAYLG